MPMGLITAELGGTFDSAADYVPPRFEPRFWRWMVAGSSPRISEQQSEERSQDLSTMGIGPGEWVGMCEISVFGVGAATSEADDERARGHIAARADIVAGENMNSAAEDETVLGQAEDAIA